MDDERHLPPKPHTFRRGDADDQIDELLPAPSDDGPSEPEQVDGPMDTLLAAPRATANADDDATTREELEVDTSADDIDDTIPVSAGERLDAHSGESDAGENMMEIGGEPVAWEPVEEPTASAMDDDDIEPINQDSDFIGSSYRPEPDDPPVRHSPGAPHTEETVNADAKPAHQCSACGEAIGTAPYCPQCGTDQYPHSRLSAILSPLLSWSRPVIIRGVLLAAVALALLALLADSGTYALIISALTIPIVLVVRIAMQVKDHTSTTWLQIGMMALIGLVVGLPLAWFAARMVRRSWFDTGVLNFGAAGFGGNFAEASGVAPFIIWLVVGLLLPIVVVLGIGAAPGALRIVLDSPPRESTGLLLSGAVAAGYVAASAIVFYQPLFNEMAPRMTTSQWTLTIFGLAVIRPLVWVLSGAMIGGVVWRYLRTASPASITIPAVIAISIPLGFSVISLAAGSSGYWAETIIGFGFALMAVFFYHRFMLAAIRNDAALATETVRNEDN